MKATYSRSEFPTLTALLALALESLDALIQKREAEIEAKTIATAPPGNWWARLFWKDRRNQELLGLEIALYERERRQEVLQQCQSHLAFTVHSRAESVTLSDEEVRYLAMYFAHQQRETQGGAHG